MKRSYLIFYYVLIALTSFSQKRQAVIKPNISEIENKIRWTLVNVTDSVYSEDERNVVKLFSIGKEVGNVSNLGIAWVNNLEFSTGIIEIELKGKDVRQQSFLGIAFNGRDEKHFEAIYFRPFNFNVSDSLFRKRAVQYIAWPDYPWERLRKETPWTYEKPVSNVVDANGWFKAKIQITEKQVFVFVNDSKSPALTVARITPNGKGKVGLWVDIKDGHFANLKITPDKKR